VDLKTQEDLIEEIGRIWGYEKIEPRSMTEPVIAAPVNAQLEVERKIREKMIGLGFDEMYNYSFYSRIDANQCGFDGARHFELLSPMNPEQALVRLSLIPNILKNIRQNMKHFEELAIFEIGRTYQPRDEKVEERRILAMAKILSKDNFAETFYSLRGAVENLLASLSINSYEVGLHKNSRGAWHPSRAAEIKAGNSLVGVIGEISPAVAVRYKIGKRVAMAEIDLEKLLAAIPKEKTYQPINKFPIVTRDLSIIVPESATYAQIKSLVERVGGKFIEGIELFDYFAAKKSLAIRVSMGAQDRTLESKEIESVMEKIVSALEKELKVEVRK
jgi:phenylalanyl-tRNA synthetase beta chain